jgi:peptide/nickel transport system permease protein
MVARASDFVQAGPPPRASRAVSPTRSTGRAGAASVHAMGRPGSLAVFLARRLAVVVAVVVVSVSATYLFTAVTRDGRSLGDALGGLDDVLTATFLHFDLGTGRINNADLPVAHLILDGLPVDLGLVLCGLVLGVGLGVGAGLWCGPARGAARDRALDLASAAVLSLPVFFVATAILLVFGRITGTHSLPFVADVGDYAQPWDRPLVYLRAIATPGVAVALPLAASCFRMTRLALRDAGDAGFLLAARARGVGEGRLRRRHVLPVASPPIVALVGVSLSTLVFNVILVEVPYNLPGGFRLANFGMYLDEDRSHLPEPAALRGVVLEAAAIIAVGMLVCDAIGAWLDPRLRG